MGIFEGYFKRGYQSQVQLQNGVAYYTGSKYPDKDFFDAHWKYGNGTTLVIPSSLVWNEITVKAPDLSRLGAVEKMLVSQTSQYQNGSVYDDSDDMAINYYKEYNGLVTSSIPYSLGNSNLWADMWFVKESDNVIRGTVVYTLLPDEFDFEKNGAEQNTFNPYGIAKDIGFSFAGPGVKYAINFSGNTALEISGTVANIAGSMSANGSGYYPTENSVRTILQNYQPPSNTPTTPGTSGTDYTYNVPPPIDLETTRDSAALINNTGQHTAGFNAGGGIDDLWVVQKASGNNMTRDEFRAAFVASNPSIDPNTLIVKQGVNYYIPLKQSDGSVTYYYAGGAAINSNAATGEYHMVVPNADGGHTIYSRIYDGNALGGEGYTVKQISTDAVGNTTYDFTGRQNSLLDDILPVSIAAQLAPGYLEQSIDADGNGVAETHQVIIPTYEVKDLGFLPDLLDVEHSLSGLNQLGQFSTSGYDAFTEWSSQQLLGTGFGSLGSGTYGLNPSVFLNPIGAFYDSQSSAYDSAASIAAYTPVIVDAGLYSVTAAQLAALDTNHDNQLSGSESSNLRLWQDLDQNGQSTAGEIFNVSSLIKSADYTFYTQGNSKMAVVQAEPAAPTPITAPAHSNGLAIGKPGKSADSWSPPASNYRSLRDTDNIFPFYNAGYVTWTPGQIKINFYNQSYLIGTDGADSFDGSYYAAYPQYFNSSLLINFLGGGGDDSMGGSTRNDTSWGGTGNDAVFGYAGDDRLFGEEGNDQLSGQEGNDALYGGIGGDILLGGIGNDYLDGGLDNDNLLGGAGDDVLFGQDGSDELNGEEGSDQLLGEAGDDRLFGQAGNDILWGGEGNDLLMGFTAANEAQQTLYAGQTDDDVLYGEGGNDSMNGGLGNDIVDAGAGNDLLDGGEGGDLLLGRDGDDQMQGAGGHDLLDGGSGNDALLGGAGYDTLQGADGNDELQGGADSDLLMGEADNDRLFGQAGNDTLLGGEGNDILVGFTANNEVQQTLYAGETDDDVLYSEAGDDNLYGAIGNDTLDGGTGADLLVGDAGNDGLWGGDGNDELQGGDGNDQLSGGAGDDRLFGQIGNDTLWGGEGNDILSGFTAANEFQQWLYTDQTDDDVLYGGAGSDALLGGLGQDRLWGGSGRDELQGGAGADMLYGEEDDDNLFGQAGDDVLYGGDGNDYLQGFTAYGEFQQSLYYAETDNDRLYGGAGSDILAGGLGNDLLDGGAGADVMVGGQGNDTYIVNSVNDTIYEQAGEGYDSVITNTNYLLNANIEELRLLEGFAIHGTGNAQDNRLIGNSSDNILDGVTGADVMLGGAGNDTYYVDNAGDTVVENAGEGLDTVQSSISTTLGAELENLILLDFAKPEKGLVDGRQVLVYGYPKRNELDYMQGDAVDNFLGTCALTAISNLLTQAGRPSSESQVVNLAINNQWTVANPALPAWQLGGSSLLDQQNILDSYGIRNDALYGYNESGIANLARSGRGVIIAVNAGKLWGDTAYVGDGRVNHAITVTGAVYGMADGLLAGFYVADSGRGLVSDMTRFVDIASFRQAANVTNAYAIYTVEPVKYWQENFDGTGNALANTLIGNRGDNTLLGLAGNDILQGDAGNDILDGGLGADAMAGGAGNDSYILDNAGDSITELAGEGADSVQSSFSLTLGANLENLTLTGSGNLNGTGNALNNTLIGNTGNNILNGGIGNDTLQGNAGDDVLSGGAGDDIISGGDGNDILYVEGNRDILYGGTGSDRFVVQLNSNVYDFSTAGGQLIANNVIMDFDPADANEKIDFSAINNVTSFQDLQLSNSSINGNQFTKVSFNGNTPNQYLILYGITSDRLSANNFIFYQNVAPVTVADTVVTNEDQAITIPPASLLANDQDADSHILKLTGVDNAVNGTVTLDVNGNIVFSPNANFYGNGSFNYTISDGHSGTATQKVTVQVNAINDAPTNLNLSNINIAENQAIGTVIGNFTTTDPDTGNTFTYNLVTGTGATDNALFSITNNQLTTNAVFDYETKNSYSIRVKTTDQGGLSYEQPLTIGINNVNEAPTAVSFSNIITSLAENTNTSNAIKVADIAITDDGLGTNNLTVSGTDASFFEIISNALYLKASTGLNYKAKASYSVNVAVDDATVAYIPNAAITYTLSVTDANDAPIVNNLIPSQRTENGQAFSYTLPTNIFSDPDGDTLTFSTPGLPAWLSFNANTRTLTGTPSSTGSFAIALQASDGNGENVSTTFSINVAPATVNQDLSNSTGDQTITAPAGSEPATYKTGSGNDTINASARTGAVTAYANTGNNNIFGGSANDFLYSGSGNDTLYGNNGVDRLYGEDDDDILYGDAGNDLLYGGNGNDFLYGGLGNDNLWGNTGADIFVLESGNGADTIRDYADGLDKFGLTNGLSFGALSFVQSNANAQIWRASDSSLLATLINVKINVIESSDFVNF